MHIDEFSEVVITRTVERLQVAIEADREAGTLSRCGPIPATVFLDRVAPFAAAVVNECIDVGIVVTSRMLFAVPFRFDCTDDPDAVVRRVAVPDGEPRDGHIHLLVEWENSR
jgi:hypothetical protein